MLQKFDLHYSLTDFVSYVYDSYVHSVPSPTEFLKIKERQKAWAVDNGLRVHEVKWNFSILTYSTDLSQICFLTEGQWRQVDDACFPGSSGKFLHPVLKGSKSLLLEKANLIFCSDIVSSP